MILILYNISNKHSDVINFADYDFAAYENRNVFVVCVYSTSS